ncbi:MAG: hypothetical protein EAY75_17760 [Bacteroidetes bacterium]|nr:MAG: hypothetical protein EAY75_17760 [Bacteroidota bacterium]
MGDTKGLRVQFTNLGSEEKADWRVTSFGRDGEGVGWNWNPEKKSFLNGKGEEFSNGLAMSIFNIAGLGVGNSFVEFSTNIATGQPLKDTRAAYGQYTQANGGSGTWAGFAWNGLSNGISNWWGDLNAGGNRTQNALLGTWLFSADLVRGSSFTLGTGKMGVFRVQGRGKYLLPDGAGNLVFNSMNGKPKTIYMFMGNYQDALAFAAKKPGSTITAFTINSRYANTILRAKHAQAMGLKSISASDAHVARGYFRIAVHSNKMQGFLNWTYKGSARILQPK